MAWERSIPGVMAGHEVSASETLRRWHCRWCGYANAGFDPCAGCHKPAPRRVRANTRAHPRFEAQTALAAELVGEPPPESA